jgi:hypothetical protein
MNADLVGCAPHTDPPVACHSALRIPHSLRFLRLPLPHSPQGLRPRYRLPRQEDTVTVIRHGFPLMSFQRTLESRFSDTDFTDFQLRAVNCEPRTDNCLSTWIPQIHTDFVGCAVHTFLLNNQRCDPRSSSETQVQTLATTLRKHHSWLSLISLIVDCCPVSSFWVNSINRQGTDPLESEPPLTTL